MKTAQEHLYKPGVQMNTCTKLYLWMPTLNFTCFHELQNIMIFFQPFEKNRKIMLRSRAIKTHRLWARAGWPRALYRRGWVKVQGGGLAGQGAHRCPLCAQSGMCNHVQAGTWGQCYDPTGSSEGIGQEELWKHWCRKSPVFSSPVSNITDTVFCLLFLSLFSQRY